MNQLTHRLVDVVSKNLMLIIFIILVVCCSFLVGPAFDHMLDQALA